MEEHLFIFKINLQQRILYTCLPAAAMMDWLAPHARVLSGTWRHNAPTRRHGTKPGRNNRHTISNTPTHAVCATIHLTQPRTHSTPRTHLQNKYVHLRTDQYNHSGHVTVIKPRHVIAGFNNYHHMLVTWQVTCVVTCWNNFTTFTFLQNVKKKLKKRINGFWRRCRK